MQAALLVISALTCPCLARPQEAVAYADEPPVYTYTYAVADDYSGSNFGADEQRDGPVASGSYYVNLPDSRVQKVNHCISIARVILVLDPCRYIRFKNCHTVRCQLKCKSEC